MDNTSCYSIENVERVKAFIQHRIAYSGMGKYYVEFPLPSTAPKNTAPGNMTMPENPENVYDVYVDSATDQVVLAKKPKKYLVDKQKGFLMEVGTITEKDNQLANSIFCHLLELASKQ